MLREYIKITRTSPSSGALSLMIALSGAIFIIGISGFFPVQSALAISGGAPSNVQITNIQTNQVTVTWTDNTSDEVDFYIERSTDGSAWSEIASLGGNGPSAGVTMSFIDPVQSYNPGIPLSANTRYWYRVKACDTGGGTVQAPGSVRMALPPPTAVCTGYGTVSTPKYTLSNTPASCAGNSPGGSIPQINWSWISGGAQSSFNVTNTTSGHSPSPNPTTGTSWSQTSGLACGSSYALSVRARNGDGVDTAAVTCNAAAVCTCGNNSSNGTEGDLSSSVCNSFGSLGWVWGYTSGNAGGTCWNNQCCGDDYGGGQSEFGKSCSVSAGAACSGAATACCVGGADCVYSGTCYGTGTAGKVDTADASGDLEVCAGETSSSSRWYDPDSGYNDANNGINVCSAVGGTWFSSTSSCFLPGGSNSCDDADGGGFCCGDDTGELAQTQTVASGNQMAWYNGISSCCPQKSCVDKFGFCMASNAIHTQLQLNNGLDDEAYCEDQGGASSVWKDLDNSQTLCQQALLPWLRAGDNAGEYPNTSTVACCGDDDGYEFLSNGTCPGVSSPTICCSSAGELIDAAGNCVATCPQPNLVHGSVPSLSPGTPKVGDTVGFTESPKNDSSASFTATFADRVQILKNNAPIHTATRSISGGISPGSSNTGALGPNWTVPACPFFDSYIAQFRLDDNSNVAETNEGDNLYNVIVSFTNQAPTALSNQSPANSATSQSVSGVTLTWTGGDDLDACIPGPTYGVSLQTSPSTPNYNNTTLLKSYNTGALLCGTTYYWGVLATDQQGQFTIGPTWSFTTAPCDTTPPTVTIGGAPASWQSSDATLTVSCTDSGSGCDSSRDGYILSSANSGSCPTSFASYIPYTIPVTVSSYQWACAYGEDKGDPPNNDTDGPVEFKVAVCVSDADCGSQNPPYGSCSVPSGQCAGTQTRSRPVCNNPGTASAACGTTIDSQGCNAADGTQCGAAINYCPVVNPSDCNTKQHYKTCQSGFCTSPPYTADVDVAGTACSGQSCGSYNDYCLQPTGTPSKYHDWSATTGTCSSTAETCTAPSFSDYCLVGTCSAECSDGNTCSSSQCTGTNSAFYQTRSSACGSTCQCPAWGPYGACLDSWNNCGQKVQCHTGTGCDTSVGSCACQSGYVADPANPGQCKLAEAYNWITGAWSSCSVQCGPGTQTRTVSCIRQSDGAAVADSFCPSPKPATSQSCTAPSCSPTTCSPDGCYGTLKWHDYPPTVANVCVSGTCENNSCTAAQTCSVASCGAECDTNTCSTSQCDNNANGFRYQQTRSSTCQSSCLCPAWSGYQSCQDSWNNCPASGGFLKVQCYQGTGCNTANNSCQCSVGYQPDGSGGCVPTIPNAPSNINFTNVTKTQIQVNWTDNSGNEDGFKIYRGTSSNLVFTSGANAVNWLDTSVACGTSYTYWVSSYNATGESSKISGTVSTLTCGSGPTLGANPGNSNGWQTAGTPITLAVSDSDGVAAATYKWDAPAGSGDQPFINNQSIISPCPGSRTLHLWAQDNVGVTSQSSFGEYQCDAANPSVVSFSMEGFGPGGTVTITASGEKPTAKWNASDSVSGIMQVELWRADYDNSTTDGDGKCIPGDIAACNWSQTPNPLWTDPAAANTGSGRDDNTAADIGDYMYGMHFVDNAGNCVLENNQPCAGTGNPVYVKMQVNCAAPAFTVSDGVNPAWNPSDTVAGTWSGATGSAVWGYSTDAVCDAADSYPGTGTSATVSSTFTGYLCFRNANTCGFGYSAPQGPMKVDTDKPTPSFTVTPVSGTVNATAFSVDASASADALTPQAGLQVRWDWEDDGAWDTSYSTIKTNSHVYTLSGTKTIRLEVMDLANNTEWTTKQVSVSDLSGPPNTPLNQTPPDGAFALAQPILAASAFADPDPGDTHAASQWQVCGTPACVSTVWDSGSDTPATSKAVPAAAGLIHGTQYWWRVRYQDDTNNWSNYSIATSFTVDAIGPVINPGGFTVENAGPGNAAPPITASGDKPTARWDVSDGLSGIDHVELWRADYNAVNCKVAPAPANFSGCSWSSPPNPIWTDTAAANSVGRDDATITDTNDYLYGFHVLDRAGNCTQENNQPCASGAPNPVQVDMNIILSLLTAGFTSCRPDPTGQPTTIQFTNTTSGGTAPYSYVWNFGDGTPNSTAQNPSHTFASSPVNLTLTATDAVSATDQETVSSFVPSSVALCANQRPNKPLLIPPQ